MSARHAVAMGLLLAVAGPAAGDDRWPTGNGKLYTQAIFDNTLFYSDQDIGGDFLVDHANYCDAATGIDSDNNGVYELSCNMATNKCAFDVDQDGAGDYSIQLNGIEYAAGYFRASAGIGVGNGSLASQSVSACIGKSLTTNVDRLFEDKDCDWQAPSAPTSEPETTPTGSTNSEAFLTDMQRRLASDATSSSTTGAEVTGLKLDLDWVGAYRIEYQILDQCNGAVGTGLAFGVEYTGTETSLYCRREFVSDSTGATGTTGTIDDVANTNGGQLVEGYAASAASTTAPNLGPNAGCTTTNTNLERIECNLLTTTAGDLTFYLASETGGTQVTVKANSTVRATPFP